MEKKHAGSRKRVFTLRKYLAKLEEVVSMKIQPWQVTDLFYVEFINFMYDVGHLKGSSITNTCSMLANILEWAALHNCRVSNTYRSYEKINYSKTRVALTPDEVSLIRHYNIDTIEVRPQRKRRLDRVRDMFVLSCNLGQRYSDMCRLSKECFERNIFRIV